MTNIETTASHLAHMMSIWILWNSNVFHNADQVLHVLIKEFVLLTVLIVNLLASHKMVYVYRNVEMKLLTTMANAILLVPIRNSLAFMTTTVIHKRIVNNASHNHTTYFMDLVLLHVQMGNILM